MTGHYAHTIDAKGRLFIPAKLREELGGTFHVTVGQDHCLSVSSDDSWNAVMDSVCAPCSRWPPTASRTPRAASCCR